MARGVIHVSEAVGDGPGGAYLKGTKSGRERVVPMTPQLRSVLAQRRLDMLEECMAQGVALSPSHFVLGTPDGAFLGPWRVTKWWNSRSREWGLTGTQGRRPVFHDLRHTYATLAVRALDVKTAQDIMGHEDVSMTMRYADTASEQVAAAGELMGAALGLPGGGPSVVELRAV